jgi:hypothetical protein
MAGSTNDEVFPYADFPAHSYFLVLHSRKLVTISEPVTCCCFAVLPHAFFFLTHSYKISPTKSQSPFTAKKSFLTLSNKFIIAEAGKCFEKFGVGLQH